MKKLCLISLVIVLVIALIFTGAACGEKKEYTLETQWEDGTFILGLTLDSRIFLETENGEIKGTDYNPDEIEQLELETKTLYPGEEGYPEGYTGPLTELYGWGQLGEGIDEATVTVTVDPPQVIIISIIRASAPSTPTCPAGMISYWKFDEVSGTTAFDSIDANNGTLVNGPVWTTGIVGGALNFDGVDDYVEVADSANLKPTDEITIEAWVNPNTISWYNSTVVSKYWQEGYYLRLQNVHGGGNGEIGFHGRGTLATDLNIVPTGSWSHIVGTYNGTVAESKIYLNGHLVTSNQTCWPAPCNIIHVNYPLRIGAWTVTAELPFDGIIDEVAIYNRALPHSEIQQHYLKGLAGKGYCA